MLKLGDQASLSRVFSAADIDAFGAISHDHNPIHVDEAYASKTVFGQRIAHGMLVASMISALIANHMPGLGSIYLSQTLNFTNPVFIGDEITAKVEVIELREDKPICTLKTTCTNQKGDAVIEGEAVVKYPE